MLAAPEAVAILSRGTVGYANPHFVGLLGFSSADELRRIPDMQIVHPDDRERLAARKAVLVTSTDVEPHAYRFVRKDGSTMSVECSTLPIEFDGAPSLLVLMHDVSKRKAAQAELMQTDRMSMLGTIAAGVAHELNNPLGYIMLNLGLFERELDELIADPEHRERLRERVDILRDGARHMASIVHDLRGFSRPQGPALPLDVHNVLEAAIQMASSEINGRATIVRDYAPVRAVVADASRLGQVFLNLLLNAAHALDRWDTGTHEIRIVVRQAPGNYARVDIIDSGCGIAKELLDRIFEPFFTTKAPNMGTGLGLSISKNIVRSMDGELSVASEVGVGSTFTVVLPTESDALPVEPAVSG